MFRCGSKLCFALAPCAIDQTGAFGDFLESALTGIGCGLLFCLAPDQRVNLARHIVEGALFCQHLLLKFGAPRIGLNAARIRFGTACLDLIEGLLGASERLSLTPDVGIKP